MKKSKIIALVMAVIAVISAATIAVSAKLVEATVSLDMEHSATSEEIYKSGSYNFFTANARVTAGDALTAGNGNTFLYTNKVKGTILAYQAGFWTNNKQAVAEYGVNPEVTIQGEITFLPCHSFKLKLEADGVAWQKAIAEGLIK
ncbi:MAG: hypothetical protein K5917_03220 [Clostridiales bacterium]|nr:hypothetical protein [Clostridiales bacterium]